MKNKSPVLVISFAKNEWFIYLYVDRGIMMTPTPVSTLHFIPFGLLPVALPILLVWTINVLDSLKGWPDLGLVWNLDACSDLTKYTFVDFSSLY